MMRLADIIPVEVDHSKISVVDLDMVSRWNSAWNPDGCMFPWLDSQPVIGSVVYYEGGLWTVVDREAGYAAESPSAITLILPAWTPWREEEVRGPTRSELRPVTWTQGQELEAQRGLDTR